MFREHPLGGVRRVRFLIFGILSWIFVGCGDSSQDPSYQRIGVPNPRADELVASKIRQPFKNELQYVVHEVALSVAEWAWFAGKGKPAEASAIHVQIGDTDKPPSREALIHLEVRAGDSVGSNDWTLHRVWSPADYQSPVISILTQLHVQVPPSNTPIPSKGDISAWLQTLLDGANLTLELENQKISKALQSSIFDSISHEKAAVLLALMALRENAGWFQETRLELSRATAHLAFARAIREIRHETAASDLGLMGEILLLTGANLQVEALKLLDSQHEDTGIPAPWLKILRVENSGDYRLLQPIRGLSRAERQSWQRAKSRMISGTVAGELLGESELAGDVQMLRALRTSGRSIEMGHILFRNQRRAELSDFQKVYQASVGRDLASSKVVDALNSIPSRTFDASGQLRVISEGHWAMQYQRHLCSGLLSETAFLRYGLGVPEDATNHIRQIRDTYQGLAIFPFLMNRSELRVASEADVIGTNANAWVAQHPELVPGECWIRLTVPNAGPLRTSMVPTAQEWLKYGILPGTALQRGANPFSFGQWPSVSSARVAGLYQLAPFDLGICELKSQALIASNAPAAEIRKTWGPLVEYSKLAIATVAQTYDKEPEDYEKWMLKAADIEPDSFFTLGNYLINLKPSQRDRGIGYIQQGFDRSDNRVGASFHARQLVDYYLEKGKDAEAKRIATDAASTYSGPGLGAMGSYFEAKKQFSEALKWYEKIDERYENSKEVLRFAFRVLPELQDKALEADLRARIEKKRPKNLVSVTLAELKGPPERGVLITEDSPLLKAHDLKRDDVIVALYGYRVLNTEEYLTLRETSAETNLVLIVWDGKAYRQLDVNVPNKRFGASIFDYDSRPRSR